MSRRGAGRANAAMPYSNTSIYNPGLIHYCCATADAYATSFMVLGLDSAKAICNAHPELDAYFIYERKDGKMDIYFTNGMKKYLKN